MIIDDKAYDALTAPVRQITGAVELFQGSTTHEFLYNTNLKSFTIEREAVNNKFFGYGICQKLTVKVIDKDAEININSGYGSIETYLGYSNTVDYCAPSFFIQEVSRDENTAELTITGYDLLHKALDTTLNDAGIEWKASYSFYEFADECARNLGLYLNYYYFPDPNLHYPEGANLEGTETLREIFDAIAEATQSIYYIDRNNLLTFRRPDIHGNPVAIIDKSQYFTLKSGENCELTAICSATELGDNIFAGNRNAGYTQYVRENPFWVLRDDVDFLVESAAETMEGMAANKFSCSWRGNYLIEPVDKIAFVTKDNSLITSYFTTDTLIYNGGLSQTTEWDYETDSNETAANPTTLGDKLKYTTAVVDKANKRIELMTSQVDDAVEQVAQIQVETNSIRNSVSETNQRIEDQDDTIAAITQTVSTQITPDQMTVAIQKEIANGVDKITTTTGFTFDETGLTVSRDGREMTTTITEDGMTVYKDGNEMLTADNTGVKAQNLHATTYLLIGEYSRLEDDKTNKRTCCYWVGP